MNKHTYRSKKVNTINWEQLRERWSGQALLFAVDVAKDGQYAELSCQGPDGAVLMHWDLLEGTAELIAELKRFGSPVAVVMESSGTYGDALRHRCRLADPDQRGAAPRHRLQLTAAHVPSSFERSGAAPG